MATYTMTRVSGVVSIQQDSGVPKYFFRPVGTFNVMGDNVTIQVNVNGYGMQFPYTDLRVGGQTPSTLSTALTLLASIFQS